MMLKLSLSVWKVTEVFVPNPGATKMPGKWTLYLGYGKTSILQGISLIDTVSDT